jgi:hypothetical protein
MGNFKIRFSILISPESRAKHLGANNRFRGALIDFGGKSEPKYNML